MDIEAPKGLEPMDLLAWVETQANALKGIVDTSYVTLIVPNNRLASDFIDSIDGKIKKRFIEVVVRPTNGVTLRIPE